MRALTITMEMDPPSAAEREAKGKSARYSIRFALGVLAAIILVGLTLSSLRAQEFSAAKEYGELCASCHGPKGFGDGPDGKTLPTKPRNFHDCALMAHDSDDVVFKEIKGGSAAIGRSNDMPSWGEALSDDQIRGFLSLVRGFCGNH